MKQILSLLLIMLPFVMLAQDKGTHFEHGLTWKEIKEKAKAENKYIMMDCFTTWCGPCRNMSENVFPLEEMGAYFNKHFINVKLQIDKTDTDNDEVKQWYAEAAAFVKDYGISAYPTFLFFSPEGKAVHRMIGGGEAKAFIARSADALDPEKQFYTRLEQFNSNPNKHPEDIRKMAQFANDAYDQLNATAFAEQYIATQKDLFTVENLKFIRKFTFSSKDKGFEIFVKQGDKVDEVLGKGTAVNTVLRIITKEEISPKMPSGPNEKPAFETIEMSLAKKYPAYADEAMTKYKAVYYQSRKDWNQFQEQVMKYMTKYGANATASDLNTFARTVFDNCPDMKCVGEALEWSKRALRTYEYADYLNTYANILYKMGKKEEAIAIQQKAVSIGKPNQRDTLQSDLDKMNKGEKTWSY